MNDLSWLAVYSGLVLLASLLGGWLPFLGQVSHSRLQLYLSGSAGVMLGASFFHVMPEAMELAGANFGWYMSLGVIGLFCIERFIAPHSHEIDGHGSGGHHHPPHGHEHSPDCAHHEHHHPPHEGKEPRAVAPAIAGWMAVLGLTIHTFMNGVGLAGAVDADLFHGADGAVPSESLGGFAMPGLSMFLAIILHKPADALAISTVLSRKRVSARLILLVQLGFALMVPIGALLFRLTTGGIEEGLQTELTGFALAFSAGTFLFIALSDLLPEVQFHRHDRLALFAALVAGVVLMGGIGYLEGHGHGDAEGEGHGHGHHHHHHHHH